MRGEQAIFNLKIKKKSGLSLNPVIHHSKVFSSVHISNLYWFLIFCGIFFLFKYTSLGKPYFNIKYVINMLVSASYKNCKIKHLPPRQEGETSSKATKSWKVMHLFIAAVWIYICPSYKINKVVRFKL